MNDEYKSNRENRTSRENRKSDANQLNNDNDTHSPNNRIYAVLGDYYHNEDGLNQALQEAVQLVNQSLNGAEPYVLHTVPYTKLDSVLAERPKLVVLSKEERLSPEAEDVGEWLFHDLQEKAVRYVESGGSWLAWHSGMAYGTDGLYRRMLRGWFLHHPEQKTITYTPEAGGHVLKPGAGFSSKDEHYFVHCDEANTNIFLRSESEDGRSIAGWTHEFGQGRVCCLTPAHTREGLTNLSLLELLANCLKFGLREV